MRFPFLALASLLLFPAASSAQTDAGASWIPKVEILGCGTAADGRCTTVSFASGLWLQEDHDLQELTISFPGGKSRTLKNVQLLADDEKIVLLAPTGASESLVSEQAIYRRTANVNGADVVTRICMSPKPDSSTLTNIVVGPKGARVLAKDILTNEEPAVAALKDGSYTLYGKTYRPIIPANWILLSESALRAGADVNMGFKKNLNKVGKVLDMALDQADKIDGKK